jgi:hypothetical protein
MFVRSGFLSRNPSAKASSADCLRLDAMGSNVVRWCGQAPSMTRWQRRARQLLDRMVEQRFACASLALM